MPMMTITPETVFQQVRQHFNHLDLSIPSKVAATFADIDNSTLTFDPANAGGVLDAALAARADGRDPATDPDVRTALTRMLLVHHSGAIIAAQANVQEKARREALIKHGPALIEAMRPVVEAAERDIAKAREALGTSTLRLDDHKMVSSLDSTRLGPWAVAREALLRVERVEGVWAMLASATRSVRVEPETKALVVTDTDDLNAITQLGVGWGDRYRSNSARAAVEAGLPLSLATFEQFGQRVAAHREAEQDREMRAPRHPFAPPRPAMRVPAAY